MALFSDKCDTPIDPATGRALTGEALQVALQNPKAPRCRNSVKKKARFCNKCGSPAPGGWIKCPNPKCKKWVGNDSQFCPHCREALNPGDRQEMEGGRWVREAGQLARRFEVSNIVEDIKRKGLVIDAGTRALLLDGGEVKAVLEAGTHTLESLGQRINHFGNPPPRTVVLVEAAEHEVDLRLEGLQDAAFQPVDLQVVLRWRVGHREGQFKNFFTQVLGGESRVGVGQFADRLKAELSQVCKMAVRNLDGEAMMSDPEGREKLLQELKGQMAKSAELMGIELTQVPVLELRSEALEALQARQGTLGRGKRELDLEKSEVELAAERERMQVKQGFESQELHKGAAHEGRIRDLGRESEQRDRERGLESDEKEHIRGERFKEVLSVDEIERLTHRRKVDLDLEVHEANVRKTEDALKLRKLKEEQKLEFKGKELELRAAKAKILKDLDPQILLAVEEDPEIRASLQSYFELQMKGSLSPENLLVLLAEKSPDAARALAQKAGVEKDTWEEVIRTQRADMRDQLDRQERLFNKAQETTSDAAKNSGKGPDVNIVK
jgi:hypothetical protein